MTLKSSESPEKLPTAEQIGLMLSIEPLAKFGKLLQSGDLVVSLAEESKPAEASSAPIRPPFITWSNIKPLETLETIGRRLMMLIANNEQLADDLSPISSELTGLRQDIADLFQALKDGNMNVLQALIAANDARADLAEQCQQATNDRLDRLEGAK